ncbi:MAG: lipopolysaccharide biosynthesis protein, partial [bacterium]
MRNTAYNAVGRLWLIGTNLLLAPLLLSYLGQDRFGVWVLYWSLLQYCLLLDMGLGSSLVKY